VFLQGHRVYPTGVLLFYDVYDISQITRTNLYVNGLLDPPQPYMSTKDQVSLSKFCPRWHKVGGCRGSTKSKTRYNPTSNASIE
jgi:hypothetical protein